mmetsp:Transcript_3280/g.8180  ORF Transcript_3280/g.8180 Transcript_3280/m.8180 type:complete len:308 (+) Transcript_3280:482-1405(+)
MYITASVDGCALAPLSSARYTSYTNESGLSASLGAACSAQLANAEGVGGVGGPKGVMGCGFEPGLRVSGLSSRSSMRTWRTLIAACPLPPICVSASLAFIRRSCTHLYLKLFARWSCTCLLRSRAWKAAMDAVVSASWCLGGAGVLGSPPPATSRRYCRTVGPIPSFCSRSADMDTRCRHVGASLNTVSEGWLGASRGRFTRRSVCAKPPSGTIIGSAAISAAFRETPAGGAQVTAGTRGPPSLLSRLARGRRGGGGWTGEARAAVCIPASAQRLGVEPASKPSLKPKPSCHQCRRSRATALLADET